MIGCLNPWKARLNIFNFLYLNQQHHKAYIPQVHLGIEQEDGALLQLWFTMKDWNTKNQKKTILISHFLPKLQIIAQQLTNCAFVIKHKKEEGVKRKSASKKSLKSQPKKQKKAKKK